MIPDDLGKVVCMDAWEGASALPSSCIDLIVTSPPYWQLREYGEASETEFGRERTVEDYAARLAELFTTLRPALKDTGSVWVNLGDTYNNGIAANAPQVFNAAMIRKGWKLRNTVIWYKPDSMAESVTKRFSQKWEPFFFYTKTTESYFNPEAAKIPVTKSFAERLSHKFNTKDSDVSRMQGMMGDVSAKIDEYLTKGVNAGDLWIIPKDKRRTGHPAPFPVELVARPIVACCPPNGVVYDPFAGSGTVGLATYRLGEGREFTGTELYAEWAQSANLLIQDEKQQGVLF